MPKKGITGDGISPDVDAQQRTQHAGTSGISSGTSTGSVRDDDIGQAERFKEQMASHEGHQFNNRKHDEETSHGYDHDMASARGRHLDELSKLSVQVLQNAVTVANSIITNAATVQNLTNNNAALSAARIAVMGERHADLSADAQIQDPSEGVSEGAIVKAGQLDGVSMAAINAAIASAIANALAGQKK